LLISITTTKPSKKLIVELNSIDIPAGEKIQLREELGKIQEKLRKSTKTETTNLQQEATNFAQQTIQSLSSKSALYFVGTLEVGSNSVLLTDTIKKIQAGHPEVAVMLISPDPPKNKLLLVTNVPKKLVDKGFHANAWASETAKSIGGKGGGKSETAQGSSSLTPDALSTAIKTAHDFASKLQQ